MPRVRAKLEIDRKRIKGASTTHTHKTPPASGTLYAFFGPLVADPPTKTIESTERRVEYIRVGYIPTRIIFSLVEQNWSATSLLPFHNPCQPSSLLMRFIVPKRVVSVGPTLW